MINVLSKILLFTSYETLDLLVKSVLGKITELIYIRLTNRAGKNIKKLKLRMTLARTRIILNLSDKLTDNDLMHSILLQEKSRWVLIG